MPRRLPPVDEWVLPESEARRKKARASEGSRKGHVNRKAAIKAAPDKKKRRKRTSNEDSIRDLREWLAQADEDAMKRFSAQLALAETLAREMDAGTLGNATSYRQLVKDIYDRVDRIYGTKNLDIIAGVQLKIEENAKARRVQGWG